MQAIKVHPEAVTLNSSTEGLLYYHGRSDARHAIYFTRGRSIEWITKTSFDDMLRANPRINCIKMDIEGTELEILHEATFPKRIRCLVFEYSYSVDPRMIRVQVQKAIRRLNQFFTHVEFSPGALKRPLGKDLQLRVFKH